MCSELARLSHPLLPASAFPHNAGVAPAGRVAELEVVRRLRRTFYQLRMLKDLTEVCRNVYFVLSGERARRARQDCARQRVEAVAEAHRVAKQRAEEQEQERQRQIERQKAHREKERLRRAQMSDSEFRLLIVEKRQTDRLKPHDGQYNYHDADGKRYWFDEYGKKRYY